MVEFRRGFRSMAAPTRELEKLIVSKKLAHGGNPGDPLDGRQRLRRPGSCRQPQARQGQEHRRIDGIVALIMAIGHAMLAEESRTPRTSCSLSDPLDPPV
jgi:phage terminase large subunit-like protein